MTNTLPQAVLDAAMKEQKKYDILGAGLGDCQVKKIHAASHVAPLFEGQRTDCDRFILDRVIRAAIRKHASHISDELVEAVHDRMPTDPDPIFRKNVAPLTRATIENVLLALAVEP